MQNKNVGYLITAPISAVGIDCDEVQIKIRQGIA